MQERWQAPGNSRIFDTPFELTANSPKSISYRTILVLRYFLEKNGSEFKNVKAIADGMLLYLKKHNSSFMENNSTKAHFYRPLIFYGLITYLKIENGFRIFISLEGRMLLSAFDQKDYKKCKEIFLVSLLNASYPNVSVESMSQFGFFPFRILFYLLKKDKYLTKNDLKTWFIYINRVSDIFEHEKIMTQLKKEEIEPYDKFYIWVIASLRELGIVDLIKINGEDAIEMSPFTREQTIPYLTSENVENMFFNPNAMIERAHKREVFYNLVNKNETLSIYGENQCYINSRHKSILDVSGKPIYQVLNLVPSYFKKICSDVRFDINVSLCQECFDKIWLAGIQERIELIDEIFYKKNLFDWKISQTDIIMLFF